MQGISVPLLKPLGMQPLCIVKMRRTFRLRFQKLQKKSNHLAVGTFHTLKAPSFFSSHLPANSENWAKSKIRTKLRLYFLFSFAWRLQVYLICMETFTLISHLKPKYIIFFIASGKGLL